MNILKVVVKTLIFIIVSYSMFTIFDFVQPIIANYVALKQMNGEVLSTQYYMYSTLTNNMWQYIVFFAILVYIEDIVDFITKLIEKNDKKHRH